MQAQYYEDFIMQVFPIYIEAGITGFESPATEYQEMGLSLDELLIQNPNASFIGLASGDSMQEIGIFSGDLLIVDRAKEVKNGSIVVANLNGNFVCKILDKNKKLLLSASEKHKPVYIRESDVFQLEGVVAFSIRKHDVSINLSKCLSCSH